MEGSGGEAPAESTLCHIEGPQGPGPPPLPQPMRGPSHHGPTGALAESRHKCVKSAQREFPSGTPGFAGNH